MVSLSLYLYPCTQDYKVIFGFIQRIHIYMHYIILCWHIGQHGLSQWVTILYWVSFSGRVQKLREKGRIGLGDKRKRSREEEKSKGRRSQTIGNMIQTRWYKSSSSDGIEDHPLFFDI